MDDENKILSPYTCWQELYKREKNHCWFISSSNFTFRLSFSLNPNVTIVETKVVHREEKKECITRCRIAMTGERMFVDIVVCEF